MQSLVFLLGLLVVIVSVSAACPDYGAGSPYPTRAGAIHALLHVSTGNVNDLMSSKSEFLEAWNTLLPLELRGDYKNGESIINPCLSSGDRLSYQVALNKCACFPTNTETTYLSIMESNM